MFSCCAYTESQGIALAVEWKENHTDSDKHGTFDLFRIASATVSEVS